MAVNICKFEETIPDTKVYDFDGISEEGLIKELTAEKPTFKANTYSCAIVEDGCDCSTICQKNGFIYTVEHYGFIPAGPNLAKEIKRFNLGMLDAVIAKVKGKSRLIVNADMSGAPGGDSWADPGRFTRFENAPFISFRCLARFFYNDKMGTLAGERRYSREVAKLLVDGTLKIKDFTPSETIKAVKENGKYIPPSSGFTLAQSYPGGPRHWHRSGSVLIRDMRKGGRSYIFGQDEGTYFGCELPKHPRNVTEAYEVLMPKEAIGTEFLRQGEWFAVPVDKKDVPEISSDVLSATSVVLPRESKDSNVHELGTDDADNIRVDLKTRRIYVVGYWELLHDEHLDLSTPSNKHNQWYTFYENTAIRSFSEEGVD